MSPGDKSAELNKNAVTESPQTISSPGRARHKYQLKRFEYDQARTTVPFRHFNTTNSKVAIGMAREDMAKKLKAFDKIFDGTSNRTVDNTNERAGSR